MNAAITQADAFISTLPWLSSRQILQFLPGLHLPGKTRIQPAAIA